MLAATVGSSQIGDHILQQAAWPVADETLDIGGLMDRPALRCQIKIDRRCHVWGAVDQRAVKIKDQGCERMRGWGHLVGCRFPSWVRRMKGCAGCITGASGAWLASQLCLRAPDCLRLRGVGLPAAAAQQRRIIGKFGLTHPQIPDELPTGRRIKGVGCRLLVED